MPHRRFTARQVFAIALAVGLAGALAPLSVEAASKVFRMAGKNNRVVAVDKAGKLSVAVRNRPSVKVPDGVAVTNQPSVKVPDGVAVTNQPSVKVPEGVAVTNEPAVKVPDGVGVRSAPGELQADTRPSMRDVVNVHASRIGVGWIKLLEIPEGPHRALTDLTITAIGPDGQQIYRLEAWKRKGTEGTCNAPNLGEFDRTILRQLSVANGSTLQLTFPTPLPIPDPSPAGKLSCLGVVSISAPNGSDSYAGITAFAY